MGAFEMKPKECKRANRSFSKYFDKVLPPGKAAWLEEHLRSCPDCRRAYEQYRSLFENLRRLPEVEASASFETRLFARIRGEERKGATSRWWHDLSRIPLPVPIGAAALILMAVFSYTQLTGGGGEDRGIEPRAPVIAGDTAESRENTLPSFLGGARPSGGADMRVVADDPGWGGGGSRSLVFVDDLDGNGDPIMGPFPAGAARRHLVPDEIFGPPHGDGAVDTFRVR